MGESKQFHAEKYRFVQLILFVLLGIITQIFWVSYGAETIFAASYYSVSNDLITILAALFMIAYIPVNYFASKAISNRGLKNGVGIGVLLTALGGLIKAIAGPNYWICFFGQLTAAIGQPYILNSWTKLSTNWFLESEKTTANGLGSISQLFGVIIAMIFPIKEIGIPTTLWIYAILGLVIAALYFGFAREKPAEPPNEYAIKGEKLVHTSGIKEIFLHNRDFQILFLILFIGYGFFNALTSEIGLVFDPAVYINLDSGLMGALVILGGILGAIIISTISDKTRKRKIFMVIAFIIATPVTALLFYLRLDVIIYLLGFLLGFTMVSLMPVGLTYAAEISYPYPEETSAGLLLVSGQISGILFLIIPQPQFLFWFIILFLVSVVLGILLRDTHWYEANRKKAE
jgi:hypothetical protein